MSNSSKVVSISSRDKDRKHLAEQVEEFLRNGGEIQQLPMGLSRINDSRPRRFVPSKPYGLVWHEASSINPN